MRRLPLLAGPVLTRRYDAWMHEALGGPLPDEPASDCADCVMVARDDDPDAHAFDPRVKCCTHTPVLANFLVGAALASPARDAFTARGQASVRDRLRAGLGVTPLGMRAPRPRRALEASAHAQGDFGRLPALVCPHYVDEAGGRCGVWAHRNATCATFFCKHVRGARGYGFWRAVEQLLRAAEEALARHCLVALDLPIDALGALLSPGEGDHEIALDPARYAALWGPWGGREEDFYRACAEAVGGFVWSDVLRVGGAEVALRARVARHHYEAMCDRRLPARLRVAPLAGVSLGAEHTRVATYSKLDPLALPNALVPALGRFDGRPTEAVVAEIATAYGLALDDEVLGALVDFAVLVDDG